MPVKQTGGLSFRANAAGIAAIPKAKWSDPATGRLARIPDPEGTAIGLRKRSVE